MTTGAAAARSVPLNAYIARRETQGFRVETRSELQAVIVRRRPLYFLLRWFPRVAAEERYGVGNGLFGCGSACIRSPLGQA